MGDYTLELFSRWISLYTLKRSLFYTFTGRPPAALGASVQPDQLFQRRKDLPQCLWDDARPTESTGTGDGEGGACLFPL